MPACFSPSPCLNFWPAALEVERRWNSGGVWEKRAPILNFWPMLVLSRRSCECYRCAGCTVVISIPWLCSAVFQPLGMGYTQGWILKLIPTGEREFGHGCSLNSAEWLCRRGREQTWTQEQDRKVDFSAETGEIQKLRSCGEISLWKRNGQWAIICLH